MVHIDDSEAWLKELNNILLEHCYNMSIIKRGAEDKKRLAVLDSIVISMINANMSTDDIKECIKDVNNDKVIDNAIFRDGGDIKKYIKERWIRFAMALFRQRSVGLGTPNAASGEGELMFLFLSKEITKPTSGDLTVNGEAIELKGEGVRVSGLISGKEFRNSTLKVCKEFKLTPNKAAKTSLDAVEIEKVQHLDHWKEELSKLSLPRQKEFINQWLSCVDDEKHTHASDKIFKNNTFNHDNFVKELVKILYSSMLKNQEFDKYVLLGDGTNVKIIEANEEDFNKKIDNGTIKPYADYFRINQSFNIGWYIE